MSDRSDRKLQQIPLASYNYRHEAEFAAGFLQDAGIPFRLQIEDPTLGLSATNSATIWVTAMDERRARQVLEHELETDVGEEGLDEDRDGEADGSGAGPWEGVEPEGRAGEAALPVSDPRPDRLTTRGTAAEGTVVRKAKPDLTLRQRVIALGGAVGMSAVLGIEAVRSASAGVPVLVALVAVILALAGVFGWAPGPLRRLLGALSGDAP